MTNADDAKLETLGPSSKPGVSKRLVIGYAICLFVVIGASQMAFNMWLAHSDWHKAFAHGIIVALTTTIALTGAFYHSLSVNRRLQQRGLTAKTEELFERMKAARKSGQRMNLEDAQQLRQELRQLNKERMSEMFKRSPSFWIALAGFPLAIVVFVLVFTTGFFDLLQNMWH